MNRVRTLADRERALASLRQDTQRRKEAAERKRVKEYRLLHRNRRRDEAAFMVPAGWRWSHGLYLWVPA